MARILALAVGATVALQAVALIAPLQVDTLTLLAGPIGFTFVNVQMTIVAVESGTGAVTAVIVEQVSALALVTRVALTFINLQVADFASVAWLAGALIAQQRIDGLASAVDTRLVVLLAKVLFMLAIDSLVQSGAVTEVKLVIDVILFLETLSIILARVVVARSIFQLLTTVTSELVHTLASVISGLDSLSTGATVQTRLRETFVQI